ncbi:hypothetical protein [Alkalicoccus urumqiensis]|uniref:PH domain-containing protein n=1 Tax=Alkalicoccus urumqiensis TaxID=1548213 RepID=A0A2P6MFJ6_ALKUR|nr:hypothetical protein [Alkalicoccus urumqiensis]PRO65048.1 hypothetical protein C6I21_11415 [Alkalicoccus urumqiensis]
MFSAQVPRIPVILLLTIQLLPQLFSDMIGWTPLQTAVIVMLILVLFVRYTCTIERNKLTFSTFLWRFRLFQTVKKPEDIRSISIERASWTVRLVKVHTYKGVNLRLARFQPEGIEAEAGRFAAQNDIPFGKKKKDK